MFGFKKWFGGSSSKTKEKESKDKESEQEEDDIPNDEELEKAGFDIDKDVTEEYKE